MKKLENYGVKELNAKEIRETDGGWIGIAVGAIALAIAVLSTDWDKAADSFKRGWDSANC